MLSKGKKRAFQGLCALAVTFICSLEALGATTCDTTNFSNFFQYQGRTYALTAQPSTWSQADQTAAAAGADLVTIADGNENAVIQSQLGSSFSASPPGTKEAWIGLSDPNSTAVYCIDGQTTPCTPMPERFSWAHGSSTFTNWSSSKPDNRCTTAERNANPTFSCYGENWATMQTDGKWDDDGDHGPTPLQLKGIVRWPAILDCVQNTPPVTPPTGNAIDPTAGLWCASQDKTSYKQCLNTTTGGAICPSDKVACNAVLDTPQCPTGTSLNTTSHTCQADPVVSCPNGGTVLGITCQQAFTPGCPAGYTLSSDGTQCEATPVCDQGVYSSVTNKCEVPPTSTTAYYTPTASKTDLYKYEPRGHTASSITDFSASSDGIQDVVQYHFGLQNGQVTLLDICAWGGKGNCGCESPNWNDECGGYTAKTNSYSGTTLSSRTDMVYGNDQTGCYDPAYPNESTDPVGIPNCANSDFTAFADMTTQFVAYDSKYGATALADISEFTTCPAGTTSATPLDTNTCTDIFTVWGVNTGIQSCTNPGQYSCTAATQACTASQTASTTGNCILNNVNPYCPTGNGTVSLDNAGITNDLCITPVIKNCPAGTTLDSAGTSCLGGAQITCPTGTGFNGDPVNKCEGIPTCNQGVFIPDSNACYNQQQTCPIGNYTCSQIQGDTTQASPGIPMMYCSPDPCVSDTTSMMSSEDTTAGTNDIKADGQTDSNGNCTGTTYFFNGTDNRCVKEDDRTTVVAITKLVAQVAAATFMGPAGAFLVSAATTIVGDAALGNLGTGTMMAVGFATISAGISSYGGDIMNNMTSQLGDAWNNLVGSVAQDAASTGGTVVNTAASTITTSAATTSSSFMNSLSNSVSNLTGLDQSTVQTMMDKGSSAASAAASNGLFSSFGPKKCCYPDHLSSGCLPQEQTEWNGQEKKLCHVIGTYCATRWLGACVVTKETSCCYDSKLSRIIAEQGRTQLKNFVSVPNSGFGTPKSPVCRGFKPDEYQYLDMRKIDFSEYIQDITTKTASQIQNMLKTAGTKFQNSQISNAQ